MSSTIQLGIGIGVELTDPVCSKCLADRVATLSELRQHGYTIDADSDPDPNCAFPTKWIE